jgi:glycolate oxidase iron-sulfur subunit
MSHLRGALHMPIVHTIELLDWASGGPKPRALSGADR